MHHSISRFSKIVLALGALALTPVAGLAGDEELLRDATVTKSVASSAEAAQIDNMTYEALFERLFGTRYPSIAQIEFVEANIWDLEDAATIAIVEPRDVLAEIKQLFRTDHVTSDMIRFYDANVWVASGGAVEFDDSYPHGRIAGRVDE